VTDEHRNCAGAVPLGLGHSDSSGPGFHIAPLQGWARAILRGEPVVQHEVHNHARD
jgi:hypothetical protein